MSLKEKLPLVNSSRRSVRYVGYIVYIWIGLVVLDALIGPHQASPNASINSTLISGENATAEPQVKCIDNARLELVTEDVLMQTGNFKSVHVHIDEYDKTIRVEVEPSMLAYENTDTYWLYMYSAVRAMHTNSPCLDGKIDTVEITTHLADYDILTTYPYKAVLTRTEVAERTSTIEQR